MLIWLKNSAIYSIAARAGLLAAIPAGYGLALTRFIGRRTLLAITLVVMIMPATALVLPLFLEASAVHLLGTVWAVILRSRSSRSRLSRLHLLLVHHPQGSARGGADRWSERMGRIPTCRVALARPIVALIAFFAFVADWNNYYLPFVMTYTNSQYPVTIGLQILIGSAPIFSPPLRVMPRQRSIVPTRDGHADRNHAVLIIFLFASAPWSRACSPVRRRSSASRWPL